MLNMLTLAILAAMLHLRRSPGCGEPSCSAMARIYANLRGVGRVLLTPINGFSRLSHERSRHL